MRYLSVTEIAKKWNVSDRMVRNYCAQGRIPGAFLTGKTWNIPADAIDVMQAREICSALADNQTTTSKYYVMGYVQTLVPKHINNVNIKFIHLSADYFIKFYD